MSRKGDRALVSDQKKGGMVLSLRRSPHHVRSIVVEALETRCLLSVVRPDHVVVVIEQDRASDAVGNLNFPYLNSLASSGLVYTNSHGVTHPSEPNTLALFSGSTQGVTDNSRTRSFAGPNLARSLFDAALSFAGYSENLPADGSQVAQSGDAAYPDLYTRNLNAMAQFTDAGLLPDGRPRPNAVINRTFNAFKTIPTTDYSSLPTVSFVVPNNLHSTHGSNEAYPWAGSSDEENNDVLRRAADAWLRDNLDPYLQWARTHNSLLIVTQDEERWVGGTAQTVTTLIHGDRRLFVPGTNDAYVNHYNVLRTIEDMYGLPRLNNTATAVPLATDAQGLLAPTSAPAPEPELVATSTSLTSSANPSMSGQPVTLTATVTAGAGTPGGTVTFKDGATVLGSVALDASGRAAFTTSALSVASHSITAAYAGDARFAASSSPVLAQVVNPAPAPTPTGAPVNDNFANRILLPGSSATATGTNVKATRESGEPRHAGISGGKSVWWTWTAPSSGTVTMDTLGSRFDTLLAVYTGTGVSALASVASNDDAGGSAGVSSKVTFSATAGRQYQVAVDGYAGATGSITLHVNVLSTATGTTSASRLSTRNTSPRRSTRDETVLA
jgi:hypothetical protein